MNNLRQNLPRANDRYELGKSGLRVGPICLGMTASPETVVAAYEEGVNFFFVTADLHWPLYDGTRRGLAKLLNGSHSRRHEIVVGVVSYLENPLFSTFPFEEVTAEVPGLRYLDTVIAGAVSTEQSLASRLSSMVRARDGRRHGVQAIGATFHQRSLVLVADQPDVLDISYIRYNSGHPNARNDLFPFIRPDRAGLVYNFKSLSAYVNQKMFDAMNLPQGNWLPEVCDYYRFVLSRVEIDGILCSPMRPREVKQLVRALDQGPLSAEEETYMISLSSRVRSKAPKY